jgi:hypothetical protein
MEKPIDANEVSNHGKTVFLQQLKKVIAVERRLQGAKLLHRVDQFQFAGRTFRGTIAFKDKEQPTVIEHLANVSNGGPLVFKVVQRVVTNYGVKCFAKRRGLHVVNYKPATDRRWGLERKRDPPQAVARHLN